MMLRSRLESPLPAAARASSKAAKFTARLRVAGLLPRAGRAAIVPPASTVSPGLFSTMGRDRQAQHGAAPARNTGPSRGMLPPDLNSAQSRPSRRICRLSASRSPCR